MSGSSYFSMLVYHHGVQAVTVREKPIPFPTAGMTGEESILNWYVVPTVAKL